MTTQPGGLAFSQSWVGINGTVYGPTSAAPSEAGEYRLTATITEPGYSGSDIYDVTIAQRSQVVSFDEELDGEAKVGEKINVATSSTSGMPTVLSIISGDGTVCTLSGTNLTMIAPGSCTVQAEQPGSRNYSSATSVLGMSVEAVAPASQDPTPGEGTPASTGEDQTSNASTKPAPTGSPARSKVRDQSDQNPGSEKNATKLAFTGVSLLRLLLPASVMTVAGTLMVLADPKRRRQRRSC